MKNQPSAISEVMSIRNNVRAIRGQNCTRNMNIQKLRDSKNGKTGKRESVELGKWLKGRESDKGRETGDAGTAEEALGANEAVYVKAIEGRGLRVESRENLPLRGGIKYVKCS